MKELFALNYRRSVYSVTIVVHGSFASTVSFGYPMLVNLKSATMLHILTSHFYISLLVRSCYTLLIFPCYCRAQQTLLGLKILWQEVRPCLKV